MTPERPIIEINNLTVAFGDFRAVDEVSFTVNAGEIFGFLGANGAGKTTTIRVMCGLLTPTGGSVSIAGANTDSGANAIKEQVGYMSQKFTLYDDLTIEENMRFKADLRRMPKALFAGRVKELCSFIGFSYPLTTMVRDLPSGVKQQVSLVATLLHDPDIIFLDEPTSGVSPVMRARFWELIRGLAAKKKTIVVTTHYMDEAEQCGRIALMRAGRLIALASPAEIKKQAYPAPVVEVTNTAERRRGETVRLLTGMPQVASAWPIGSAYHAALRQAQDLPGFLAGMPEGMRGRTVTPSLEDVFIRLVEGADR